MRKFLFIISIVVLAIGAFLCWYYRAPIKSFFTRNDVTDSTQDTSIAELQSQISQLNENVNTLLLVVEDKEYQIQVMTFNLNEAYDEIDSQNRALDTLCNEIDLKNSTISQLETEKAQLQAEYDELSQDIADHEERLAQIEERLEVISNELTTLNSDITSLQNQTNHIQSRLDELEELTTTQSAKIETMQSELENINVEITNLQTQINELKTSLEDLSTNAITIVELGAGYIKYSDGTLIQHRREHINKAEFITFPTPFVDENYTFCATSYTNAAGIYSTRVSWFGDWGVYIFVYMQSGSSSTQVEGDVSWIAIGRWK